MSVFAIFETDGRQIRAQEGDVLQLDLRDGVETGTKLKFDRVLLANGGASSILGGPVIDGASVSCEVVEPIVKGEKLEIQKFRRRHNSRRHTGHRQKYTHVKVTGIQIPGLEVAAPKS
ncbi:50S ribosomal protein L21 [Planctomyces sp. SH-PL14]|jgi:large subunit ribosomal protein L21|uniref:50S ribosomal protein L21 n=1 Tax=Planctomyces sp. SH-PL14 TaxID=1632864 RepID=UPI00078E9101|nr:50S ribosomal protein L21 [Planctomyces sp. SH-PL14]AMV17758.1 50S ribosomal protein L21 [Planctomyces sp. SH-PL14]